MNLTVVKVGGNIIDNPVALNDFLREFQSIAGAKILVHGGGKVATDVAQGLGIEAIMLDGRRVTDEPMLRVVTMVYAGMINKNIVAKLQYLGCNALGLTGADGTLVVSKKRPTHPVDYGYVGDPISVNVDTAKALLDNGLVPIIAPLTYGDGEILNTNADTMAQTIATGLAAHFDVDLVFKFEKRGVLRDINDGNSVMERITPRIFEELKAAGIVDKGMLPKLTNALAAVESGVRNVFIGETVICNSEL